MELTIKLNLDEMSEALKAGSLEHLANALKGQQTKTLNEMKAPAAKKETKPAADLPAGIEEIKGDEPPFEPDQPAEETAKPTYSLEDIRAKLNELNKAGRKTDIQALFAKFGAKKLPEVAEKDYDALMAEALAL